MDKMNFIHYRFLEESTIAARVLGEKLEQRCGRIRTGLAIRLLGLAQDRCGIVGRGLVSGSLARRVM
jgi:hypothetical protein